MSRIQRQACPPFDPNLNPQLLVACCLNRPGIDRSLCGDLQAGCPVCDQAVVPYCTGPEGATIPECRCIHGRDRVLSALNREGITVLVRDPDNPSAPPINVQNGPAVCWYAGCQFPNVYVSDADRQARSSCPSTQVCLVTGNVSLSNVQARNITIGQINCRFDQSSGATNTGNTGASTSTTTTATETAEQTNPFLVEQAGVPVWGWILIGVGALLIIIVIIAFATKKKAISTKSVTETSATTTNTTSPETS